jgi:hypothetical protein
VPWLRRLVAGFPPRRPGFETRSGHVEFVVDKVAVGRFTPSTSVSAASSHSISCSMLITYLPGLKWTQSPKKLKEHTYITEQVSTNCMLEALTDVFRGLSNIRRNDIAMRWGSTGGRMRC